MGLVNFEYYSQVYMGEADETAFPALCARASDVVGAVTHWRVNETNISRLPALHQELYKKAICAQIDFFNINGLDSVNDAGNGGYTVGKVTVHGKANTGAAGAMSTSISPMARQYLEQTGLMNPQVCTFEGWWL